MAQKCNNCGEDAKERVVTMSEWAYEAHEARHERQMKRMWIALIVSVAMIFASNAAWLVYESQFDTFSYDYSQDGNGQNNINYGEQGDLINEPTTENQGEEEKDEQG